MESSRDLARASEARYRASPKGRAARAAYMKKYNDRPERRARVKEASARHRIRRAARHAARLEAARAGGCVDCGSKADIHFHHLDPSTKAHTVADMYSFGDEVFDAEVAKCVVVCGPCHRERHRVMRVAA